MTKEFVCEDLAAIKKIMHNVLGTDVYKDISRMGGLTNHTYKIILNDNEEYVVRIPGEGTEQIIVRVRFGSVCISGVSLRLCKMTDHQLVIAGKIQGIELLKG